MVLNSLNPLSVPADNNRRPCGTNRQHRIITTIDQGVWQTLLYDKLPVLCFTCLLSQLTDIVCVPGNNHSIDAESDMLGGAFTSA